MVKGLQTSCSLHEYSLVSIPFLTAQSNIVYLILNKTFFLSYYKLYVLYISWAVED